MVLARIAAGVRGASTRAAHTAATARDEGYENVETHHDPATDTYTVTSSPRSSRSRGRQASDAALGR